MPRNPIRNRGSHVKPGRLHAGPDTGRGTGTGDPGMIGYTLPAIRRLLISLGLACALAWR
jgi:hypothetical protein